MEHYDINIVHAKHATDFIGVKINDNNINVHVPEAFRCDLDNIKYSMPTIIQLLRSISLADTINRESVKLNNQNDSKEVWSIDSYLWIINDFIDNGYYYPREKIYTENGTGKIDWRNTIKKTPIISKNNIIYPNVVISKVVPSNSIVTQIYKYCLDISLKRIGWIFDFKFQIDYEKTISNKEMKHILLKELSATFDVIKRLRFRHMISILEGAVSEYHDSSKHTYGIEHYYYVFEKMVDIMFGNISDSQKKKYNPPTYWVIGNDNIHRNSPLEPDTIHNFINNEVKTTYIIDSKLYSYGCTASLNDLPGSQSIQKQITYGDYVKNTLEEDNDVLVRNMFILPYNKENNDFNVNYNLYCFGYSSAEWRNKDMLQDHDYIFGYFIDFNYLLVNYKNKGKNDLNDIYSNIEKKLKFLKEKNNE